MLIFPPYFTLSFLDYTKENCKHGDHRLDLHLIVSDYTKENCKTRFRGWAKWPTPLITRRRTASIIPLPQPIGQVHDYTKENCKSDLGGLWQYGQDVGLHEGELQGRTARSFRAGSA